LVETPTGMGPSQRPTGYPKENRQQYRTQAVILGENPVHWGVMGGRPKGGTFPGDSSAKARDEFSRRNDNFREKGEKKKKRALHAEGKRKGSVNFFKRVSACGQ